MKTLRTSVFVAFTVGMLCVVAGLMVVKRYKAGDASPAARPASVDQWQAGSEAGLPELRTQIAEPAPTSPVPENGQALEALKASGQTKSNAPSASAMANRSGSTKETLKDPIARAALALVGTNPDAEAYWYEAINDPNLPPNERQDLIEDLNEDGLSDPKHPTPDDLPLIVNRLFIIEEVAWDAMDAVNADAFEEAYKDLVNLANLARGSGEPVR